MTYVTVMSTPIIRQMRVEELFEKNIQPIIMNNGNGNTRTFVTDDVPEKYRIGSNIQIMIRELQKFNASCEFLKLQERHSLYNEFYLPKKSGGLRKIDAPDDVLKKALNDLKDILERTCGGLYHTSAFAYIKGRSTIKALQRHQRNESRWYAKLDLSNFFGSTTMEFCLNMLSKIYPFSEIMSWEDGKEALANAIELGFLDGGLPQGTPLSPTLTNIIMIPIDFEFNRKMREKEQNFVCTRYADDFTISSKYDFNIRDVEETLRETLREFDAPYILKEEKSRYGSSAGQNWNLGLMINADNEITVGHKKKRQFKAMLTNYILDTLNEKPWELSDVQTMEGLRSYYTSVEKDKIEEIIAKLNEKFGVNIKEMIRAQLHGI